MVMRRITAAFITLILVFSQHFWVFASDGSCPTDDPCHDKSSSAEKVVCYTNVVNICSSQRENMAAQITYLTTRVELTKTKIITAKERIFQLETEIDSLGEKITRLEKTLTNITDVFLDRIVATYKSGAPSTISLILGSNGFTDFVSRFKYIQTVQSHDRKLLFQLQNSKENFKDQKIIREEKKVELDGARKQLLADEASLEIQKREKEIFLSVTKNNEKIYRQNLDAAQREHAQIQQAASILSSAGKAQPVKKGDVIGLMGNSGFSTGSHLHFGVYNLLESDLGKFNFDAGYENPFNLMQSRELTFQPNSCDDVGSSTKKKIGSGSWQWPMENPYISQCFGHTPFSNAYYRSGIHSGVDMVDDEHIAIHAVEDGNAYIYRGGQSKGNGVFIFHSNGKMTLYWHLQ